MLIYHTISLAEQSGLIALHVELLLSPSNEANVGPAAGLVVSDLKDFAAVVRTGSIDELHAALVADVGEGGHDDIDVLLHGEDKERKMV